MHFRGQRPSPQPEEALHYAAPGHRRSAVALLLGSVGIYAVISCLARAAARGHLVRGLREVLLVVNDGRIAPERGKKVA